MVSVHFPSIQQVCLQTPLRQATVQDAPPWGGATSRPGAAGKPKPGRREGNITNPSCTLIN